MDANEAHCLGGTLKGGSVKIFAIIVFGLAALLGLRHAVNHREDALEEVAPILDVYTKSEYNEDVQVRFYFDRVFQRRINLKWMDSERFSLKLNRPVELRVEALILHNMTTLDILRLPGIQPGEEITLYVTTHGAIAWSSR